MNARALIPAGLNMLSKINTSLAGWAAWELFCRPRRLPRSEEETAFWRSGQDVTFASGRKARSWGNGPLIFFLHGWESRGSGFFKMIPKVVEAGFKVVTWDGPAHGESPANRTNMPNYASSLATDLKSANFNPVGLIGHSLGGSAIGVLMPLPVIPTSMVFISSPSRIDGVFERFSNVLNLSPATRAALIKAAQNEVGFSLNDKSLTSLRLDQSSHVLCLHDQTDKEIPFEDFEVLKNIWTEGEFESTKGLGHRRIIRDPAVITRVVDFLVQTIKT